MVDEKLELMRKERAKHALRESPLGARRTLIGAISASQCGYGWWLCGNVYEALVRVPEHLANGGRLSSIFAFGSPVLYYLPGLLLVLGGTTLALIAGWKTRIERKPLIGMATFIFIGICATAYLVPAVNLKLFVVGPLVTPTEQLRLLHLWHRVNVLRIIATACAWLIAARILGRVRLGASG
jgi:hypothetical protein